MSIQKMHNDYTLGLVTALPLERTAVEAVLDETHVTLRPKPGDTNAYTLGEISGHNVVITSLPSGTYGTNKAAIVASQMRSSFPNIQYGLMVGIAGGAPRLPQHDIRLGDVVVGRPTSTSPSVVQYDFGKMMAGGLFQRTGTLSPPPLVLLASLSKVQSNHMAGSNQVPRFLAELLETHALAKEFNHPGPGQDRLFAASYDHNRDADTCDDCDTQHLVERPERSSTDPVIHYGVIGSGNGVMKDSMKRDSLAQQDGILCFEMEAAGIVDYIPSLVIRGICDYSDTHKNKQWQEYAAAAAAAYAKEFLSVLSPSSQIDNRFKVALNMGAIPAIDEFIGRRDDLEKLWELLHPEANNSRKVVVLHGLSGIGKTQLAIRFIRDHKDDFTAIIWVNAENQESVLQSLAAVYSSKFTDAPVSDETTSDEYMEKRAMDVLRWLGIEGNSKWLLVFDGLEQYPTEANAFDIRKFFPASDQGSILLTTRVTPTRQLGQPYRVSKLNAEESLSLLTYPAESVEQSNLSGLDSLLLRLDGHPLAIVLARSFMDKTGATPGDYLQQYVRSWRNQEQARQLHYAWTIPLEKIKESHPIAFKMLLLLSCFERKDIWPELVMNGRQNGESPSWYAEIASNNLEFYQAMHELLRLSLVESSPSDNSYFMHPVVQDLSQHYIAHYDRDELLSIALTSIGLSIPKDNVPEIWKWQKRIIPHASRIYELVRNGPKTHPNSNFLSAHVALGNLFLHYGKLREAEVMYQRAYEGHQLLDAGNPELLTLLDKIGLVHQKQCKYIQSEENHLKVLTEKKKRLEAEDLSILDTIHHLAGSYASQGKLRMAEGLLLQTLEGRKDKFGISHPSTLDTMDALGTVYSKLGDTKSAMKYYQRAFQGYRKQNLISAMMQTTNNMGLLYLAEGNFVEAEKRHLQVVEEVQNTLGEDHPSVFNAIENLGLLHAKQGRYKEAERYLFESLTKREQFLGPDHPSIVVTRDNIAFALISQGKVDEAEYQYQQALASGERTIGLKHTTTLRIINNFADLLFEQGRFKEAEEKFLQAVNGYLEVLGPTHTETLSVILNLGSIYKMQDKTEKADEMYGRALAGYRTALGGNHASTLDVMNNIGMLRLDQGRFPDSEKMLEECFDKREKLLGPDHPSTLEAIDNLGFLRYSQGMLKDAEDLTRTSLTGWGKIGDTTNILQTKNNLGMILTAQGNFDEAKSLYEQALVGYGEILDPDHPLIHETIHNLGVLAVEQGMMEEGQRRFEEALTGRESTLGPRHTSTLETLLSLANLFRDQGKVDEAKDKYNQVIALYAEILGPKHPSTLQSLCDFGVLLLQNGELPEAEKKLSSALEGLESMLGSDHIFTARAVLQMGRLRSKQGRFKEAVTMYSRARLGFERMLGKDHRETVAIADMLRSIKSELSQWSSWHFVLVTSVPVLVVVSLYLARVVNRRRR
ncbi:hypothetical protein AJ79_04816 [Helicocarpus griseus UAMH5409]|uniref:Nucleoside phosphorylase domain-containing protein n=1 Tax=Helicocarpus griseus UAMH5409 TaxID=1447875 RepID=A0A2B7XSI5_9EURO|nr:hypothetical protein AJ79_04816 [Helicocarpus griseus UAMH5409]